MILEWSYDDKLQTQLDVVLTSLQGRFSPMSRISVPVPLTELCLEGGGCKQMQPRFGLLSWNHYMRKKRTGMIV